MSMMFSSKSSVPLPPGPAPFREAAWRVVLRGLMTAILPLGNAIPAERLRRASLADGRPAAGQAASRPGSAGREAAVHEDDLPGHVVAGRAGQEHRGALEVGRLAVA